ncbi:major facilitator superfamily domain-containing protein [Penicillium cf. griseofulvum]|uniref:Major facilitator superfamily domain-containing protein n=1 Tax=Penicillium cf. griseofulvum TaxID=2972120 RepID=A0A9W9JNB3_9EURO|nr:major facilitator superfamily domain-containing protein [Penicillium cf. griseofulvum]KAJ5423961.1 major facilitator superfamily domain-containing protein [Penicillium cf. griseofulvum]
MAELGYMSAGPTIGDFMGSIAAAIISDPLIKFIARRNNGIYEPEYRFVLMAPEMVLSAISYILFWMLIGQGQTAAL